MPNKFTIFFSLLFAVLLSQPAVAQLISIKLNFPEHKKDTVILAHYYYSEIFANDTLILNQNGEGEFSQQELLPQGIYMLYFGANQQLDFLIGKQQILTISKTQDEVKVTGATESKWFQSYVNYLNIKKKEATRLHSELKMAENDPTTSDHLKKQLSKLDREMQSFWKKESAKAPDTFYGKFVGANIRTIASTENMSKTALLNDSLRWVYSYNFNKSHYWDHFDLFDLRMWRTPMVHNKLNEYFNRILLQQPDSVLPAAIELIEESREQPEIFQNLTSFILNNSVKSDYMGIENVFVAIAEKYYLTGKASWVTDKTLETIRREVFFRKNNLLGATAKELFLEDEDGQYHSLLQISTPFTMLVFWEPGCGYCKKQVPELFEEVFLKTDPSQLTIMAVCTQDKRDEWMDFIEEHELDGWINVWDPNRVSNFQVNYNTRTTPMIYLLDKNKKIIAKKLTVEQAKKILDQLIAEQN